MANSTMLVFLLIVWCFSFTERVLIGKADFPFLYYYAVCLRQFIRNYCKYAIGWNYLVEEIKLKQSRLFVNLLMPYCQYFTTFDKKREAKA